MKSVKFVDRSASRQDLSGDNLEQGSPTFPALQTSSSGGGRKGDGFARTTAAYTNGALHVHSQLVRLSPNGLRTGTGP